MSRCCDCGFLAIRRGDGELLGADRGFRTTLQHAALRRVLSGMGDALDPRSVYRPDAICARNVVATFGDESDYLREFERDRDCDEFAEWMPLLSPREHADALERQRLLEWQAQQELFRREFEAKTYREMRVREDARDKVAKGRHRDSMWILGGLVAAATIIAALVGANCGSVQINMGVPTARSAPVTPTAGP